MMVTEISSEVVMDDKVVSLIIFLLAVIPWISYCFMIFFFTISLIYGDTGPAMSKHDQSPSSTCSTGRLKLHKTSIPPPDHRPGVSIVKPLMGVDPYLEFNLESHFTLDYPEYELLLCVEDSIDPALDVIKTLQNRYPNVDCRIFIGGKSGVQNPMVFNMSPGYEAAKYDIVWISTSRIQASTEILLDMVAKLQHPNVALVHQIPFTTDQTGFAHAVEKVYFGTTVARFNLAFHVLGISCITGMSYLVKKDELDKLNGLSWFGKYLAEDFFIAKYLHEKGFYHQVSAVPAQQNVANVCIATYKDRLVRWLRLRLNMMPITAGLLEPLGASIPLGIYASWSVHHFFDINPYLWLVGHLLVWATLDYMQLKELQRGPLLFNPLTYLLSWLVVESLFVLIYFEAIINPCRVTWGKRTYKLSWFGTNMEIVNKRSILPI